ncbi:hypothetical protein FACS1894111_01380 [Clostridia bacterium]|nr:hypothetical protein FACS1894111_01380 [Clostridia bacterium]
MKIRQIEPTDYAVLKDFLYHAIFVPTGAAPLPRDVIEKPEIAIYINGFNSSGKEAIKGDCGVVAVLDGKIVGVAWTRIIPAFGHIDDETPELAISVFPEYRKQGIGTDLLKKLFELLAEKGYKQTSLSVQKDNPALHLYERLGYKTVRENGEDFIMLRDLKQEVQAFGMALGMCFGLMFGAVIGTVTDDTSTWLPIGMCLGVAIGGCSRWWSMVGKRKENSMAK